ncbi:putative lipoprotein [Synechococcus sp. MIT S9220]|nr:putative lipoprotein [Synechococcus sp. MIT S9220]
MMKSLLITLLSISLVGCFYSSEQKAKQACEKWRMKRAEVTITSFRDEQPAQPVDRAKELELALSEIDKEDLSSYRDAEKFRAETRAFQIDFFAALVEEDQKGLEMIDHQVTARWCRTDSAINQILGYENKKVITSVWQNKQGAKGKGEVAKRYRY